jgi:hypothetical protein
MKTLQPISKTRTTNITYNTHITSRNCETSGARVD